MNCKFERYKKKAQVNFKKIQTTRVGRTNTRPIGFQGSVSWCHQVEGGVLEGTKLMLDRIPARFMNGKTCQINCSHFACIPIKKNRFNPRITHSVESTAKSAFFSVLFSIRCWNYLVFEFRKNAELLLNECRSHGKFKFCL